MGDLNLAKLHGNLWDQATGKAITATVTIYPAGSVNVDGSLIGTPAASDIYADQEGDTPASNPFATSLAGVWECWAAPGASYDVRFTGAAIATAALLDVQAPAGVSASGVVEVGSATQGAFTDIRRLRFRSIGTASVVRRSHLAEIDGDFFQAVNAHYSEADTYWYRVDVTKHAYLWAVHGEHDIQDEGVGGFAMWVAAPDGSSVIGNWSYKYGTAGGWQKGFILSENRALLFPALEVTLTGAGSAPFGRLVHLPHDDPTGQSRTALVQGASYLGSDSWALDSESYPANAFVIDEQGSWEWWYYPSTGATPFTTADWRVIGKYHGTDGVGFGRLDIRRQSSTTDQVGSSFYAIHITDADMVDGFGAGVVFGIQDAAGVENLVARVHAERAGADNTGDLVFTVIKAGAETEGLRIRGADGALLSDMTVKFDRRGTAVETGTSRTLTSDDYGRTVILTNDGDVTVTLPAAGAYVGTWIECVGGGDASGSLEFVRPGSEAFYAKGLSTAVSAKYTARAGTSTLIYSNGTNWMLFNQCYHDWTVS
jgi:hypothetical protein